MKEAKQLNKDYLDKKLAQWNEIEVAILELCDKRKFDPNIVAPVLMCLYADISKDVGASFEHSVSHALNTLSTIYEVKLLKVDAEKDEDENLH